MKVYYHGHFINQDDRRYDPHTLQVLVIVKVLFIFEFTKPGSRPKGKPFRMAVACGR